MKDNGEKKLIIKVGHSLSLRTGVREWLVLLILKN